MDIFESLENLDVSEECFDDIMGIVEEIINELKEETVRNALQARCDRQNKEYDDTDTEWAETRKTIPRGAERKKYDEKMYNKLEKMSAKHGKKLNLYKKWIDSKKIPTNIVEAIINEVSLETAKSALKKRLEKNNDIIDGLIQYKKDALNSPDISQEEYDEIRKQGSEAVGKVLRDNENKLKFYEKWRKGQYQRKSKQNN